MVRYQTYLQLRSFHVQSKLNLGRTRAAERDFSSGIIACGTLSMNHIVSVVISAVSKKCHDVSTEVDDKSEIRLFLLPDEPR